MRVRFKNGRSEPMRIGGSRPEWGVQLPPRGEAIVTLTNEGQHQVDVFEDRLMIWNEGSEKAVVEVHPAPDSSPDNRYDELGRLRDPALAQQQVMAGLYDLWVEAGDAGFDGELLAELNRLRLRFMDDFEASYPGYGEGRAVWR